MQTLVQVFCRGPKSLRDQIVKDEKLPDFGLVVSEQKRQGRPHGWAKLHGEDFSGAINLEWHAASQTLICRVVTRSADSHAITSALVNYLLARLGRQILSVQILPPTPKRSKR
jgi:hypothetical protein